MFEAGQMKISVNISGDDRRSKVIDKPITLDFVINYIHAQGYDPYIEERLIKAVRKYPQQALTKFVGTIPSRIVKIQSERKNEEPVYRDLNDAADPEQTPQESFGDFEEQYSDPIGEKNDQESFKAAIQRTKDDF